MNNTRFAKSSSHFLDVYFLLRSPYREFTHSLHLIMRTYNKIEYVIAQWRQNIAIFIYFYFHVLKWCERDAMCHVVRLNFAIQAIMCMETWFQDHLQSTMRTFHKRIYCSAAAAVVVIVNIVFPRFSAIVLNEQLKKKEGTKNVDQSWF